jgi:exodeoxyribonuclease VII small subunit
MAQTETETDTQGFDQVLQGLRGIVEKLESGSLSLEQALAAFEEGVRLSRRGAQILDAAEHRVEILLRGPEGQPRTAPFADPTTAAPPTPAPPKDPSRG